MSLISDALKRQATQSDNNKTVTVDVEKMFNVANKILDQIYPTLKSSDDTTMVQSESNSYKSSSKLPHASVKICPSNGPKPTAVQRQYEDQNHKEMVNHPSHYQGNRFEVIDIIEDYGLGFNLGNAIKYILRAGKKNNYNEDLNKAIWYLQREISNRRQ